MSELSVLELETEHAELLPERETLFAFFSIHNHVSINQNALAIAVHGHHNNIAIAVNVLVISPSS